MSDIKTLFFSLTILPLLVPLGMCLKTAITSPITLSAMIGCLCISLTWNLFVFVSSQSTLGHNSCVPYFVLRNPPQICCSLVNNVRSDTFGNPMSQKVLAIILHYKRPGMLCLALPARRKVLKLDFQSEFPMSKIIQIFLILFFIEE